MVAIADSFIEGIQADDVAAPTTANGTPISAVGNPYTFTGRRLDTETGLMYFRNRYYSVDLGRFISRDALEYVDGWSLNAGYFAMRLSLDPLGYAEGGDTSSEGKKEKEDIYPDIIWVDILPNLPGKNKSNKEAGVATYSFTGSTHKTIPVSSKWIMKDKCKIAECIFKCEITIILKTQIYILKSARKDVSLKAHERQHIADYKAQIPNPNKIIEGPKIFTGKTGEECSEAAGEWCKGLSEAKITEIKQKIEDSIKRLDEKDFPQ